MSSKNYHILIVDDDPEFHQQIRYAFRRQFLFSGAIDAIQLQEKLATPESFDLVLLDMVFDDSQEKTGLRLIPQIRAQYPQLPVVVVTADRAIDTVVEAMKLGAKDFLVKDDFDFDYWYEKFTTVIESSRLREENSSLREEVKRIRAAVTNEYPFVGESPQIQEVKRILRLVSEEPEVTVLITGETGTGKEVAARYLHSQGARKNRPFQAINLSAIQDSLLESTLFGHRKGAFTGATRDMEGYFAQADSGVLLLDEIGDIDMNIQIKLLRFLETKLIRPVGSDQDVKLDLQIVAATHRNLEQAVVEGRFRADLYQRLKAMVIELPPLRARREDILLLLKYYLQTEDLTSLLTPEAIVALVDYDWVGNVRELKNAVGYMQLRAKIQDTRQVTLSCLPPEIQQASTFTHSRYTSAPTSGPASANRAEPVAAARSIEEEHAIIDLDRIEKLLVQNNRVKKDVAAAAGLDNTDNLRYLIKKYYTRHPHLFVNFPCISQSYRRIVKPAL
jgi:DNA-binding NtrC family response regulator